MAPIGELFHTHSGDPQQLDRTAQIFFGVNESQATRRDRLIRSRSARVLTVAFAASIGLYGYNSLSSEPVCTSGTPVEVTNPTSSALRGEFESKGCQVLGGEKMVTLTRATGEQYAAPKEDVRPVTQ